MGSSKTFGKLLYIYKYSETGIEWTSMEPSKKSDVDNPLDEYSMSVLFIIKCSKPNSNDIIRLSFEIIFNYNINYIKLKNNNTNYKQILFL